MRQLWGSSFIWACLKFNIDFKDAEKNWEKVYWFFDKWIWLACVKLLLFRRKYLSSAANVLTTVRRFCTSLRRTFPNSIAFTLINKSGIKVLASTFQRCFGPFTMWLVERSSQTRLFRNFSYHVFRSLQFPNDVSYDGFLFDWKRANFKLDFKNAEKTPETFFVS